MCHNFRDFDESATTNAVFRVFLMNFVEFLQRCIVYLRKNRPRHPSLFANGKVHLLVVRGSGVQFLPDAVRTMLAAARYDDAFVDAWGGKEFVVHIERSCVPLHDLELTLTVETGGAYWTLWKKNIRQQEMRPR